VEVVSRIKPAKWDNATSPYTKLIPGRGTAYILEKILNPLLTATDFMDYRLIGTEKVEVDVFNYHTAFYTRSGLEFGYDAGKILLVTQDMDGNLWITTRPQEQHYGKVTTSPITFGSSGTVTLWKNGAVTSPAETVTAYFSILGRTGDSIAVGKWVEIRWEEDDNITAVRPNGRWLITNAECP
jgi:hypothetical protein